MCTCTSCEYTDSFHGWKLEGDRQVPDPEKGGFERWPRGEPAWQRSSDRAYAAHARHVWAGAYKTIAFTPGQAPRFPAWTTSKALGDGGEHRKYPSPWGDDVEKTTAEYVAEFVKENGYVTEEKLEAQRRYRDMVKREERAARKREQATAPLIALAQQLRAQRRAERTAA